MTSYQPYRTEKAASGNLFFKDNSPIKKNIDSPETTNLFESINRYYSALQGNSSYNKMEIKNCFALTLAEYFLKEIPTHQHYTGEGLSFTNEFYSYLSEKISDEINPACDSDLLIIFLKQTANLLRRSRLISLSKDNCITYEKNISREKLYFTLLNTLWNNIDWKDIFPSSPEAAEKIWEERSVLLELLLNCYSGIRVEDLANDFFTASDICGINDFFMISFLDFYVLTWLRHFGIVDYNGNFGEEPVELTVPENGRKIIQTLL